MSMFTTFGSFSIAAGILLIFLIFVMLAAERRGELGIARAIGTRRTHLVQMFLYEGLAYDLVAAAVGALLGIAVAFVMVLAMAAAFNAESDVTISFSVKPTSIVIAYAIGVLLTLAVVAFSAWRVSRMNIVSAIRNLPEPPAAGGRRARWLLGAVGLVLGRAAGRLGRQLEGRHRPRLRCPAARSSASSPSRGRLARPTVPCTPLPGFALVAWFILPMSRWLLGDLKTNFSMFILGGLAIVVGASWALMYNADVLLGGLTRVFGRNRRLAPVLKLSLAYPLASRFRTGVTLAMFTLVVFTLVTGAITTGSFLSGFNNIETFGGGFDIRATTAPASPIRDMRSRARARPRRERRPTSATSRASRCCRSRRVRSAPARRPSHISCTAPIRLPRAHDLQVRRDGEGLLVRPRSLGRASHAPEPGGRRLAGRTTQAELQLRRRVQVPLAGFYLEDRTFTPDHGRRARPADRPEPPRSPSSACCPTRHPLTMAGIWTSQTTLAGAFGNRVVPTVHLVCAPARRRSREDGAERSSRPSSRTACRPTRGRSARGRRLRERHLRPPHRGLHGPRPDRRRRRARRRQRPLGGRTPPADRRAARHRLPPQHGAGVLPARVVVRRAHRDRRRHRARARRRLQRHRPTRGASRAGRTCPSTSRGSRSA